MTIKTKEQMIKEFKSILDILHMKIYTETLLECSSKKECPIFKEYKKLK